ncbi:hypothetical protein CCY99_05815 [Helicobacter sp. 16-1353]|uniref:KCU-star family selenoprotein n=1 Tax=Helicobacter sp. 16-1353 TaxID=2004996 RepID=UPI000DCF1956|nr:KCU-star family selenoprotein [Helicobacter sp. 16-1353]RAX53895.1 hypothetical protein CCY99_05815 [Helicobacter sp. 16-1353]
MVEIKALFKKIKNIYKKSDRFFHLLVGMPSYDKYLEHMEKNHPDKIPKTQKEFFREAQDSKYGPGSTKC